MTQQQFDQQGRRYRAFLGWPNKKIVGFLGTANWHHFTFSSEFFNKWAADLSPAPRRTIRDAIIAAKAAASNWSGADSLKVYGYEGLLWPDTVP